MIKTIILNGPPGSGKDTIANLIVEQCNATKHEFKFSLYKETADYYKVDLKEFIALAIHRIEKESLKNWFGIKFGITPRNALIHVSEDIIKPLHGLAYFGDRAAERLTKGLNVFSDGGFISELEPVSKKSDETFVIRFYRKDFNFDNDSRNYIYEQDIPHNLAITVKFYVTELEENKPQITVDHIKQIIQP